MIMHNQPDSIDSPEARCPTHPQVGEVTAKVGAGLPQLLDSPFGRIGIEIRKDPIQFPVRAGNESVEGKLHLQNDFAYCHCFGDAPFSAKMKNGTARSCVTRENAISVVRECA
jgi:hypothetical protein